MNDNQFHYNYTAPTQSERKEIEALQKKYLPKEKRETNRLEKLRALDKKVHDFPTALGIIFGVVGTLIFGLGLTMILEWELLVLGSFVSVIGLVPLALAHPIYKKALQKRKEKYSEEILSISKELLDE
ncbi:MAG: hypothetical protein IJ329_00635 [Clostridia bacterium]|nr:hypothetical protein [Clostridia bacterium]